MKYCLEILPNKNRFIIGSRSFLSSLGATAASTFVGIYAVIIGAGAAEMGWLQSSVNSISNGGQILWGKLSDKAGRRKGFLALGSLILAILWFLMPMASQPIYLIIAYSLIALFGSMITVNWFSLIADLTDTSARGKFLAFINNISSVGTIISLVAMIFLFNGNSHRDIEIPFYLAAVTYVISAVMMIFLKEDRHRPQFNYSMIKTLGHIREDKNFYPYFEATNVQGFFWSMAWPMFPITIVSLMNFNLSDVAILTIVSLSVSIVIMTFLGKYNDKKERPPLIFLNRIMLSLIPIFYAFSNSLFLFVLVEIYSGFLGALQNIVMNSYLLDIIPNLRRAEYISIINGFNGLVYLLGALTGGYLLEFTETFLPLGKALMAAYMVVFLGRFGTSFLFLKLREPEKKGRTPIALFSILYRQKMPGNPSGGTIRMKD